MKLMTRSKNKHASWDQAEAENEKEEWGANRDEKADEGGDNAVQWDAVNYAKTNGDEHADTDEDEDNYEVTAEAEAEDADGGGDKTEAEHAYKN